MEMSSPASVTEVKEIHIVSAAARNEEGAIICSPRHWDATFHQILSLLTPEKRELWRGSEQGFVDQHGKFYTRREAHAIAIKNGQRRYRCGGDEEKLYTENLY